MIEFINIPLYDELENVWIVLSIQNDKQFCSVFKTQQEANEFYWSESFELKGRKALNIKTV